MRSLLEQVKMEHCIECAGKAKAKGEPCSTCNGEGKLKSTDKKPKVTKKKK